LQSHAQHAGHQRRGSAASAVDVADALFKDIGGCDSGRSASSNIFASAFGVQPGQTDLDDLRDDFFDDLDLDLALNGSPLRICVGNVGRSEGGNLPDPLCESKSCEPESKGGRASRASVSSMPADSVVSGSTASVTNVRLSVASTTPVNSDDNSLLPPALSPDLFGECVDARLAVYPARRSCFITSCRVVSCRVASYRVVWLCRLFQLKVSDSAAVPAAATSPTPVAVAATVAAADGPGNGRAEPRAPSNTNATAIVRARRRSSVSSAMSDTVDVDRLGLQTAMDSDPEAR
jgi:hypothetical protein